MDVAHARWTLHRLLDLLGPDEGATRPTLDRWFGPSRPKNEVGTDAALPQKWAAVLETAIQAGFSKEQAEKVDSRLLVSNKRAGAVTSGHPHWPSVCAALAALREPSRVGELLAIEPGLPGILDPVEDKGPSDEVFRNWDKALPAITELALRTDLRPRHIRVLGLTLGRAWDFFTRSFLSEIRSAFPNDPLQMDLLQLDPDAASTADLSADWPRDIAFMRQKIGGELVEPEADVTVCLREYRGPVEITGVGIGDAFVGSFVGFRRPARPTKFPYFLVRKDSPGAAGALHAHCEACWDEAWASSRPVALITP